MNDDVRVCKSCNRKYTIDLVGGGVPGCKEREEIICPHCGSIDGYMMTDAVPFPRKAE